MLPKTRRQVDQIYSLMDMAVNSSTFGVSFWCLLCNAPMLSFYLAMSSNPLKFHGRFTYCSRWDLLTNVSGLFIF